MSFVLITGASKGIGRAIATEFAARKYDLLLVARSEELLSEAAGELEKTFGVQVYYLPVDLSKPHAAKTIFDWCTEKKYTVNVLVNNAGYGLSGAFDANPVEQHLDMMIVNMVTPVTLISLFLPQLKQQKKSYILNIGSSSGYQAMPFMSTYAASKSFMVSFSRALTLELKDSNIVVTVVSPGVTTSEFNTRAKIPEKGLKAAEKVTMSAEAVAKIAVRSLFKEKTEVVVGFLTKLTVFFVSLMPKKMTEKISAKFYK